MLMRRCLVLEMVQKSNSRYNTLDFFTLHTSDSGEASHPSGGFLQVEAADEGRDLAALHGLSFTLPAGLLTPLTGGK